LQLRTESTVTWNLFRRDIRHQAVLSRTSLGPNRIAQGCKQILLSQDAPVLFDQPMFHRPARFLFAPQVLGHITNPIPKLRFQRRLLQQSFLSPVIHCAATAQGNVRWSIKNTTSTCSINFQTGWERENEEADYLCQSVSCRCISSNTFSSMLGGESIFARQV
jgi:hypothetical protein